MSREIVYLCRGHGYAHATRARLILPELLARAGSRRVRLASTGSGVEYFELYGIPCDDLGIADVDEHTGRAVRRIFAYLRELRDAAVVLADELLLVPRLCPTLGLPCVLLACSLRCYEEQPLTRQYVDPADRVIVADWPSLCPIPRRLAHKATAVGPIVPAIGYDKRQARAELGLPGRTFIATVALGSLLPLKSAHLRQAAAAIFRAWAHAPAGGRLLLPFSRAEARQVLGVAPEEPNITWLGRTNRASGYYRASDVVFSAGTSTTSELARNAIPTVAVCPAAPEDDRRRAEYLAARAAVAVADGGEHPDRMWALIHSAMTRAACPSPDLTWGSPAEIAELVTAYR